MWSTLMYLAMGWGAIFCYVEIARERVSRAEEHRSTAEELRARAEHLAPGVTAESHDTGASALSDESARPEE